jgi:hypothetical protein
MTRCFWFSKLTLNCDSAMASCVRRRRARAVLALVLALVLAPLLTGGLCNAAAAGQSDQSLAILLKQLQAKPVGLYDGMRLFHLKRPDGGRLTLTLSCEREQWRVQSSDAAKGRASFYDAPFLSAKGIARTWVCTTPARALE